MDDNANETKRCPYCAEVILAAAVKCKHCGSMLSAPPAAAPPVASPTPAPALAPAVAPSRPPPPLHTQPPRPSPAPPRPAPDRECPACCQKVPSGATECPACKTIMLPSESETAHLSLTKIEEGPRTPLGLSVTAGVLSLLFAVLILIGAIVQLFAGNVILSVWNLSVTAVAIAFAIGCFAQKRPSVIGTASLLGLNVFVLGFQAILTPALVPVVILALVGAILAWIAAAQTPRA